MPALRTILIFLTGLLCACMVPTAPPAPSPYAPRTVRVLALGDSYTIGQGVTEEERYPVQLAALLEQAGVMVNLQIIARSGWTTEDLLANLNQAVTPPSFDWVSVLIGANDHFGARDVEEYRVRFREILARSVALAGGRPERVLVLSLPDWSATPFGQRFASQQHISTFGLYQAALKAEAWQAGTVLVDVTPSSYQVRTDPSLLAEDGLHYSGKMYARWAAEIWPTLIRSIQP